VRNALLHGGTSSVWALGHPPEAEGWLVELGQPPTELLERGTPALPVRRLLLSDVSLSVSATWGRIVKTPLGGWRSHVLDPTTGLPVRGLHRAVVTGPSATDTEALSTGLLVAGPRRSARWQEAFPGTESTYD
jgi:thiamine biosynthesis lipoprotein